TNVEVVGSNPTGPSTLSGACGQWIGHQPPKLATREFKSHRAYQKFHFCGGAPCHRRTTYVTQLPKAVRCCLRQRLRPRRQETRGAWCSCCAPAGFERLTERPRVRRIPAAPPLRVQLQRHVLVGARWREASPFRQ